MPFYYYECTSCKTLQEEFRKMSQCQDVTLCNECGQLAELTIHHTKTIQVNTFKPYVETNFGDKPVLVESKEQRDRLLRATGTTYDRLSRSKPKRDDWRKDPKVEKEVLEKINAGYVATPEDFAQRLPFDDGEPGGGV